MPDLSHIVLHVALCRAAAVAPANATSVPIHVRVRYERGQPFVDKVFDAPRGSNDDATVELDLGQGHELITLDQPASGCGAVDFVTILPDHGRRIEETLVAKTEPKPLPAFEMAGTAPLSFLTTTKPTIVAFASGLACGAPVTPPLPIGVLATYDTGAYYLSMADDRSLSAGAPVLALRLRTSSGKPHYIHIPTKADEFGHGIDALTMNVTDDMVDGVATEPQDVLLCPKVWETSVQ